jgi:hypothetical protein
MPIILASFAATSELPAEPIDDPQVSIIYDAATGRLELDAPTGVELTSINIASASGIFTGDPVGNLEGPFDIDSDTTIFKATFGTSFDSLSFGNVAQPLLDQAFLLTEPLGHRVALAQYP